MLIVLLIDLLIVLHFFLLLFGFLVSSILVVVTDLGTELLAARLDQGPRVASRIPQNLSKENSSNPLNVVDTDIAAALTDIAAALTDLAAALTLGKQLGPSLVSRLATPPSAWSGVAAKGTTLE